MDTHKLKEKADRLEVSEDVYIFLRQSNRKIRYFSCDLKRETIIIDGESITFIPSREDSYDRLVGEGFAFASEEKSVEDIVIEAILRQQLQTALGHLNEGERRLIEEIFYLGRTQRDVAEILGISQPAVKKQFDKVLEKLRKIMGV